MFAFDRYNTKKISFQIPVPLFYTNDLIYVGSNGKINITFNVSPTWWSEIIGIAGSNTCAIPAIVGPPAVAAGVAYTFSNAASTFKPCSINICVTDMKLYLARAHVLSIPRNIKHTYHLKQFSTYWSSLANPGNNNNFSFSFKENRRISHIAIAFVNTSGSGTTFGKYSPTDFSSGFSITGDTETKNTTDALSNISKLVVNFCGNIYPICLIIIS